jgi:HD domain.
MIDERNQYGIAIAAILHDVGKLKQRAFGGKEECISQEAKDMEAAVLPGNKFGGYGYRHALWSYDFFLKDLIPNLNNKLKSSLDWEAIAVASSSHHRPSKGEWSEIIAKADRLSAGSDRLMSEQISGSDRYLSIPLRPITSNISITGSNSEKTEKSKYSYELRCLNDEGEGKAMFPVISDTIPTGSYKTLYQAFLSEVIIAAKEIKSL